VTIGWPPQGSWMVKGSSGAPPTKNGAKKIQGAPVALLIEAAGRGRPLNHLSEDDELRSRWRRGFGSQGVTGGSFSKGGGYSSVRRKD
jgi:hypothetical protein